jgi:murein DD-endopeptidase MepM/ murein hydrolase activator NlpD
MNARAVLILKFMTLAVVVTVLGGLSGCQRPDPAQQPTLFQVPMEYLHLMQTPLPTQLPVPVEGVKPRQISDTWGAARSEGRTHQGTDIFAKRGTPVLSTTEGMILSTGVNNLGGNVVWVLGPAMSRHYYAHLERYGDYQANDWVQAGDVIGYVGNSGNARTTPPHLHYGIYLNGEGAVNPYPYLQQRAN